MKRFLLFAAIGALLSLVVSCQKTPTAELSVSQNEYTVQASGGSVNVSVSSNVDLTVRISAGWITQAGGPSSGGGTYSFTIAHNDGYDARTATITFSNGEQGVSETVTITQAQQDAIIPGSLEYKLFYEAQTFSLPVSTNVDCSVSVTGGDWIKSLGTRGLTTKQYQFSIAENTGKTPREAVVTITSGSLKQSIKVEQLPTTHRPVTKEEWKSSFKETRVLAEESKTVIDRFPKDPVSGWNTKAIASSLSSLDGVISAVPDKSGKVIYVMQRDSSIIPVVLEFDEIEEGFPSFGNDGSFSQTRGTINETERSMLSPNGQEKKALLLAPYHHELPLRIKIDHKHVKKELSSIGYKEENIKYYEDSEVKLDYVTGDNQAKYDLIIINTHGGLWYDEYQKDPNTGQYVLDSDGHYIGVGDPHTVMCLGPIDESDVDLFISTLEEERKECFSRFIENGNDCKAIGEKWFEATTSNNTKYSNSLMFAFACYSFALEDIYSFLTDHGLAGYCGFINTVKKTETPKIINSLVSYLTRGMSIQDAADYTFNDDSYEAKRIFRAKPQEEYTLGDVFLVDPRAYELKETPQGNSLVLGWKINTLSGKSSYDLIIDDKLAMAGLKTDSYTIKNGDLSAGSHTWYIVTHIMDDKTGKTLKYYNSKSNTFDITGPSIPVTGIRLTPSTITLEEGQSSQLTATVYPANATNKKVLWSSNYPESVSVDENGLITAIKRRLGVTIIITAKTEDGEKTATCRVYVNESTSGKVAVTGISLGQSSAEIKVGDVLQLNATVAPSNATNKTVTWSSSNNSVATVSSSGLVSAKTEGTAKITAKTEDGGKTASVTITVKKADGGSVSVTGVSIDKSSISLKVGESETLKATVSPTNATNKGLTWASSMSSVATVTSDGVVTAKAAGTATITVKTDDGGKTATCNVTVTYNGDPGGEISVSQVTISPTTANMTVGDTKQFSVKIDPANATNQEVSWSSSEPSVASVDSKGMVTAKAEGKATITVTAKDGGVSSKATVTVSNKVVPVTGVTVSPTSLTMEIGDSKSLTVTVNPADATDKTYTVSSDNTGVVEIDKNNNVVANGAGTANVTVTTTDGAQTATCKVTVNKPQMTIEASPTSLSFGDVNVGESSTKTFTISNTGKAEVKVSGISVPTAFGTDASTPFTIAVGQSKTVTVTFTPTDGKDYSGTITITSDADNQPTVAVSGKGVKSSTPSGTPKAVDLGLPSGLLWASCNLGATKPEEYGDYYAWGEIETYYSSLNPLTWREGKEIGYKWLSYRWTNDATYYTLTKYCTKSSYGYNKFTDGKTVLDPEDDAAHVHLGGKWRMPTDAEWTELRENCTWTFETENGVDGQLVEGQNGNSIFLPCPGWWNGTSISSGTAGRYGYYWSSSLEPSDPTDAWCVSVYSGGNGRVSELRMDGISIRPVMDK